MERPLSPLLKIESFLRHRLLDVLMMIILALTVGWSVYYLQQTFNPVIYAEVTIDAWFDADIPRLFENLTDRQSNHARTNLHPLFSLLAYPGVQLLLLLPGMDSVTAVRLFMALAAAFWMALLYLLLRLVTGRILDALLFSLVAVTSAAAFFWLTVPETYLFSSLTLILVLVLAAAAERTLIQGEWWAVLAGVASLTMLITNWMAGLLVAFIYFPWRRAVQISLNALVIVVVLWAGQKLLFPTAGFFLSGIGQESRFLLAEKAGGLLEIARSFFLHTLSMPQIEEFTRHAGLPPFSTIMITQSAPAGSGGGWGIVAVILWIIILILGLIGIVITPNRRRFQLVVLLLLLGQLLLVLFYGDETFLYSLNFLPVLVVFAALGSVGHQRPVVLALAGLLAFSAGINNYGRFQQATAYFDRTVLVTETPAGTLPIPGEEQPSGRERVLAAQQQRPEDP